MEVARHWRIRKQRYALVGVTCPNCSAHLFPPREVCPICAAQAKDAPAARKQEPALVIPQSAGHAR